MTWSICCINSHIFIELAPPDSPPQALEEPGIDYVRWDEIRLAFCCLLCWSAILMLTKEDSMDVNINVSNQGCQIFLGTWYQKRKNVSNEHNAYQMVIGYSKWPKNRPNGKKLQNLPKLGFLVWKFVIWHPCLQLSLKRTTFSISERQKKLFKTKSLKFVFILFKGGKHRKRNLFTNYLSDNLTCALTVTSHFSTFRAFLKRRGQFLKIWVQA
jgi:hypothetical protein